MSASGVVRRLCRQERIGRLLLLVAGLLFGIAAVLLTAFVQSGANSGRYAEIQEGMTLDTIQSILEPLQPPWLMSSSAERPVPFRRSYRFEYQENSLFPRFVATLTFVDERPENKELQRPIGQVLHLESKELQKPTLREILEYWWSQVRRR